MRSLRRFFVLFFTSAPFFFLFWLVFVGTFSQWELLLGAAVAIVGSVAICIVEYADEAHFRPRFRDLAQIIFVPWMVVQGTYELVGIALRDLLGGRKAKFVFRRVPFQAGDVRDPHDTAVRVLAVTFTTMSPNSIVLGINTPTNELIIHEIKNDPVPGLLKRLGGLG